MLFVGTSIIHPSTEGVFLLCNILDLLIYSYNRLWKMLIDKNMKRIEMQYLTGISGNILARMGKNQYVSMETIEKICKKLDCTVDEMMEFTDDE